ncbi:tapasin-related protein isoform X1 [Acanthopagrus latus]|uniref:tapasin-related protein isoform X1 n=2 Tax=Acanthopagrus latus TaxID=8177 RepID=UPI00187C2BA1|nr:tapasin-related protein isoform X1 [Acanthopagrus latus]
MHCGPITLVPWANTAKEASNTSVRCSSSKEKLRPKSMGLILKILIYLHLFAAVQCVPQMSWLPCQFIDEHVFRNIEGHTETDLIHREAMLQFGQKGDAPVNPNAITFLVTGSKLDLRRYIDGVEVEQLECELRRYSTQGIHVRWPVKGAEEYNRWFSCTLKHTSGLFTIISFLRHPTDQPPSGQQDYHSWPAIADREIFTTTVVMVLQTQTPSVIVGLSTEQKLHCHFAVDHKTPNITVEWHFQHRGERAKLFSHTSRTGQVQGSGVGLKALAGGDASYKLPLTKMSSEGMYICSVSVMPLFASLDISLHIEEAPIVTLNVGPTLLMQEGQEQKVICEAEKYYPLDVEIVWYQGPAVSGQRVGAPLPKVLQNILLSSHRHNQDKTYSLSAFFYLQPTLSDSGRQYTCSVSHKSLRVPIRKSFILTVEEPSSWIFTLTVVFVLVILLVILCMMLPQLLSAGKRSVQKKPY